MSNRWARPRPQPLQPGSGETLTPPSPAERHSAQQPHSARDAPLYSAAGHPRWLLQLHPEEGECGLSSQRPPVGFCPGFPWPLRRVTQGLPPRPVASPPRPAASRSLRLPVPPLDASPFYCPDLHCLVWLPLLSHMWL